jgi:hypothetical protein
VISDSPYQTGELLLTPLEGAASGLAAAVPMLAVVFALEPGSGATVQAWLDWLGGLARLSGSGGATASVVVGLVVHGCIGACLGLLYAASQQRIPMRALIGVGAFYGLFLWIAGKILLGWVFATPVREVVHSWVWLAGACAFGMSLALIAGWAGSRRPKAAVATPKD